MISPIRASLAASCLVLASPSLALATDCYSGPGCLDALFGGGSGKVLTNPIPKYPEITGLAIQADGKIVAAGTSLVAAGDRRWWVIRYETNGTIDPFFGVSGVTHIAVTPTKDSENVNGVAIQADGKIVVAGQVGSSAAFVRLNTDGSLDSSFDGDGRKLVSNALAREVAIQNDGKIVSAWANASAYNFIRLNTNGSLDTSFSGDGLASVDFGRRCSASVQDVALQADGKIVAGGYVLLSGSSKQVFAAVRMLANGTVDSSFGTAGKATIPFSQAAYATAMALQADGGVVLAGRSRAVSGGNWDFAIARMNANGSTDLSFNGTGTKIVDLHGGADDYGTSVKVQPDGKIVMGGHTPQIPGTFGGDFALLRLEGNGAIDTGFGNGGVTLTHFGGDDASLAMVLDGNGYIVLGGYGASNAALARYLQ